jgi:hypothetical protein
MITVFTQSPHKSASSQPHKLLDGYLTEQEYADQRNVSLRTCQRDRALRQSPPYIVMGRDVYYRVDAVREWMLKNEQKNNRITLSLSTQRLP